MVEGLVDHIDLLKAIDWMGNCELDCLIVSRPDLAKLAAPRPTLRRILPRPLNHDIAYFKATESNARRETTVAMMLVCGGSRNG